MFDSRTRRDGRSIEDIGFYDALANDKSIGSEKHMKVDVERARHWLRVGAKPSEIVRQIFKKTGVTGARAVAAAANAGTMTASEVGSTS